ncbi:MAG: hypothetical protein AB8H80_07700 [Planctomycetota bacterium]
MNVIDEPRLIQVPMGGVAAAGPPQVLTTLLGSCVGMIVQDLRNQVAVLAHVVRPTGHGAGMGLGYFADRAAPHARDLAIQNGADPRQLVVRLAGGGCMLGNGGKIGAENLAALKDATYALGMAYGGQLDGKAERAGGCLLVVDPARGKAQVRRLQDDAINESGWRALLTEMMR